MCFVCSKELSHRDGTFEYPQDMFWLRNTKNNFQLHTLIWAPGKLFLYWRLLSFFFKLWFPCQQIAPIGLKWGKSFDHTRAFIFLLDLLVGNQDMHKSLDEFELQN